jgi:hypothetical protein
VFFSFGGPERDEKNSYFGDLVKFEIPAMENSVPSCHESLTTSVATFSCVNNIFLCKTIPFCRQFDRKDFGTVCKMLGRRVTKIGQNPKHRINFIVVMQMKTLVPGAIIPFE